MAAIKAKTLYVTKHDTQLTRLMFVKEDTIMSQEARIIRDRWLHLDNSLHPSTIHKVVSLPKHWNRKEKQLDRVQARYKYQKLKSLQARHHAKVQVELASGCVLPELHQPFL